VYLSRLIYFRVTSPVLWTPKERSALGWWGATRQPTYPLTDLTPTQFYILPCPPRLPYRAEWLNFVRAAGRGTGAADLSQWMRRRATGRAANLALRSPQQHRALWLTGLARVTGHRGRGFSLQVTPPERQGTTWGTNRSRRWATRWAPGLVPFADDRSTGGAPPEKRPTGRTPALWLRVRHPQRRRRRWGWRTRNHKAGVPRSEWSRRTLLMWSGFQFVRQLRHHARLVHERQRGGLSRNHFVNAGDDSYLWVNRSPARLPHRRSFLPFTSRRRRRRWRRWYPGPSFWVVRNFCRRRLKIFPRRQGYLGLISRLGLPLSSKIRWWRRPSAPKIPLVRASSLLSLRWQTRWRSRRRHRRRRRGGVWRAKSISTGVHPHQQRWPTPPTVAALHLRRLASLLVCRARRWTTEGVARRLQRTGGWSRLYLLGYTSVGYRTHVKAGAPVKVPVVLSSVKSLVLLRRWLTRAVIGSGGRTWSNRVTTVVDHPAGVVKQRQEFIIAALTGAASL